MTVETTKVNELTTIGTIQDGDVLVGERSGTVYRITYNAPTGVEDGDKGDITVASSGTVWTIDNDAVTYAKMQNVSATQRILGRDTAGAGDVEELTAATVKTMLSLNNVENTALSTWAGSTNITTLGTISTGTWSATSIALNKITALTASRAVVSDASGFLSSATTTSTEIGYVNGVTSAIQTQLNGKQASDAELSAIAGLTSAADKIPYFTGSGTAALADFSSAMRTFLTTSSSANLASLVTDETGSGALVFATSPTLVTPLLGTPTSGVLTNCTDYRGGTQQSFRATKAAAVTLGAATHTKMQVNSETWDTSGTYDNATNYRHTPTIAGKYLYVGSVLFVSPADQNQLITEFYKNGSLYTQNSVNASGASSMYAESVTIVDMNGSTDYIELYAYRTSGGDVSTVVFEGVFLGT